MVAWIPLLLVSASIGPMVNQYSAEAY